MTLELRWPAKGSPGVGFRVNGLFGALGLQILLAAVGSSGLLWCDGCPNVIETPRKRGRPPRYCTDCKARHIPQQRADRRRQEKKSESASVGQRQASTVG